MLCLKDQNWTGDEEYQQQRVSQQVGKVRVEASCGGEESGSWAVPFEVEKQGLMVFRRVAEALLNNSGVLRKPRKE